MTMARFLAFLSAILSCQTSWAQTETNEMIRYWADTADVSPRIIGGDDADQDRFPYYVMLLKRNDFVCGGTLIASDVVLSSAHCDV
jgi:secreted trypsin-like serine protease